MSGFCGPAAVALSSGPLGHAKTESTTEDDSGPHIVSVLDVPSETDNSVVAAQMLPEASGTGEDVSIYELKWVEIGGVFVPIIVQNANGPCPLLALCNVLILRGGIKITAGHTDVSSTYLLDMLATYLLEYNKTQELSAGEQANLEQNIQDTMTIFPKLQTGLDVNVRFDCVSGFEFTRETGLFDLVGVPLYHGWVVDPQNSQYCHVVKDISYNQLVEKVINNAASEDEELGEEAMLGQLFLESTASQLTYHGICELNTTIKEGDICVFFRNNHFNTLIKKNGYLFTLVTDHGFLNELGYVWQALSDIDGGGEFLDAHFHLSPHSQSQTHLRRDQKQTDNTASHTHISSRTSDGETGRGGEETEIGRTTPHNPDFDYQTALRLQQQEYIEEGRGEDVQQHRPQHQPHNQLPELEESDDGLQEQQHQLTPHLRQHEHQSPQKVASDQEIMDQELALVLQQEEMESQHSVPPGPNTVEEYERISASERQTRNPSSNCILF